MTEAGALHFKHGEVVSISLGLSGLAWDNIDTVRASLGMFLERVSEP